MADDLVKGILRLARGVYVILANVVIFRRCLICGQEPNPPNVQSVVGQVVSLRPCDSRGVLAALRHPSWISVSRTLTKHRIR
jgi:hypothetical protein